MESEWEKQEDKCEFIRRWNRMNDKQRMIFTREFYRVYNEDCIRQGVFSRRAQGIEFNIILN